MKIKGKKEFINLIKSFSIVTKCAVIKPNWVSNVKGEYTEAEILAWLLEALPPDQKKIIIESYTPWRGLTYQPKKKDDQLKVDLIEGKSCWDFYKRQDEYFLKSSGTGKVLDKFKAEYLNITNEFWKGSCISPPIIKKELKDKGKKIVWEELCAYFPQKLYQIKNNSTLISLAKIKIESANPNIVVSASIKNLFGLIPHPSRHQPFHDNNDSSIPQVTADIFSIYFSLFDKTLWIAEGIKSLVRNYCEESQCIEENKKIVFVDVNPISVDTQVCREFGINPKRVPYFKKM